MVSSREKKRLESLAKMQLAIRSLLETQRQNRDNRQKRPVSGYLLMFKSVQKSGTFKPSQRSARQKSQWMWLSFFHCMKIMCAWNVQKTAVFLCPNASGASYNIFLILFRNHTVFENHRKRSHSTLRAKRATFTF